MRILLAAVLALTLTACNNKLIKAVTETGCEIKQMEVKEKAYSFSCFRPVLRADR